MARPTIRDGLLSWSTVSDGRGKDLLLGLVGVIDEYPDLLRPHSDGEPCGDGVCRLLVFVRTYCTLFGSVEDADVGKWLEYEEDAVIRSTIGWVLGRVKDGKS